jgi:hypothetical protein
VVALDLVWPSGPFAPCDGSPKPLSAWREAISRRRLLPTTRDEIGSLTRAFNEMAIRLRIPSPRSTANALAWLAYWSTWPTAY